VVGALKMTSETCLADIFPALGSVSSRNFIFWKDGCERTFRDAGSAIYTCIRINVHPREFFHRFTRDNAFHGTHFNTATIT
jgi:hypothetical protein